LKYSGRKMNGKAMNSVKIDAASETSR